MARKGRRLGLFLGPFFSLAILASLAGLGGCSEQQEVQSPVEELPSPDFKTKPQIYFVFEKGKTPFNLPVGEEIRRLVKFHAEVVIAENSQEFLEAVRRFNGRSATLLLLGPNSASKELLKKSLAHTSRNLTLHLVTHPEENDFPSKSDLVLDLPKIEKKAQKLCSQIEEALKKKCHTQVDPKSTKPSDNEGLSLLWSNTADPNGAGDIWLSINWPSWLSDRVHKIKRQQAQRTEAALSFANGSIQIQRSPMLRNRHQLTEEQMNTIEDLLKKFRMESLMQ